MKTVLFDARSTWACLLANMVRYFNSHKELKINPMIAFHNIFEKNKYGYDLDSELIPEYWASKKESIEISYFSRYDSGITGMGLWDIIYADRFLKTMPVEKITEQIAYYDNAWRRILDKTNPEYVVTETVSGIPNFILFHLCAERKITYLGFLTARNSNRYYYTRDLFGHFPELSRKYLDLSDQELDGQAIDLVDTYLNKFNKVGIKPSYMNIQSKRPSIVPFLNPLIWFKRLIKDVIYPINDKLDIQMGGARVVKHARNFNAYLHARRALRSNIFEMPEKNEKYILFPLHFQPEASTYIWASHYSNQLNTVVSLARSIPADHCLYIKEHSVFLGTKEISFYQQIKNLPNVRLIDPFISIYGLIKGSSAVAVLTSTTGLEAILMNKPLLLFGKVFYDILPGIIKVRKIYQLTDYIKQAINFKGYDDVERKKFVYSYLTSGYKSDLINALFNTGLQKNDAEPFCRELLTEIHTID